MTIKHIIVAMHRGAMNVERRKKGAVSNDLRARNCMGSTFYVNYGTIGLYGISAVLEN